MRIIENTKTWLSVSLSIILVGLIMSFVVGLNYGIDFTGGTLLEINMHKYVSENELKSITNTVDKNITIGHIGKTRETVQIRSTKSMDNNARDEFYSKIKTKYNLKDSDLGKSEQFGPAVGKEIRNKAFLSVIIATIGILIYIRFRFDLAYGIAAVASLLHDVLIVVAIYAIFRVPINSPFVAAMLTVLGYSMNDTIVVFDRIRENMRFEKAKKVDYVKVANESIKQTLIRSLITSMATLMSIVALYFLGVEAIKDFTFPLIAGIITGTFSSIFIASPVWVILKQKTNM